VQSPYDPASSFVAAHCLAMLGNPAPVLSELSATDLGPPVDERSVLRTF
jgi:hypothetical protein